MEPRVRVEGWKVPASRWYRFLPALVLGYLVLMEAVLTEELDEEEQLVRRHRKEKKELQAKIQGMKNAVPKNDKKRRKQLTEDVAKLEKEMEQKHREELEQLKLTTKENKIDSVAVNISNLVLENQPPRISKAQKRREKKAALEKEREERIAEAEIENLSGARHMESEKLAQILAARQLEMKQIPSDGHCMYRAIEDQLKEKDCALTVVALRSQTAEYMQSHVEDFLPFLTNPNTGDMCTPAKSSVSHFTNTNRDNTGRFSSHYSWRRIFKTPTNTCIMTERLLIKALSGGKNTKIITLNGKKMTKMPSALGKLPGLKTLVLQNNLIPKVCPELRTLTQLTTLNLGNNLLEEVPEEIKYLTSLKTLHLSGNRICRFAPGACDGLQNLILLNLNNNHLMQLPQEVSSFRI
uniref:ubiquitinyl hydrolase 1 n=1 Tax=Macaca mulatta TaxID=9544 RepID=A0A5F8AGR3_MACMU